MKKGNLKHGLGALFLGLCLLSIPVKTATAAVVPPIASTPCDTLYYESLSARAWLEAQREITQNQNIILKPDSVLEYTCFDMFLRELAQHASNMLSETSAFGGPMSSSSMDNALESLIGSSLRAYGVGNFGHNRVPANINAYDLLGGHSAGAGIGHDFSRPGGAIVGGAYNCNIMQRVWQAAKCINFASHLTINGAAAGTPTDGFFTFQEYADLTNAANALDRRHRPSMCYNPVTDAAGYAAMKGKWSTNMVTAYITPPWTEDPVKTYLTNITAPVCGGSPCPCSAAPIPTGVQVNRPNTVPLTYPDKICVQPGCRYNPAGGDVDGDGAVDAEGCFAR